MAKKAIKANTTVKTTPAKVETAKTEAAKVEAVKVEATKVEAAKTEVKEEVKTTAKKAATKTVKAAEKVTEKKTTAKKTAENKNELFVQFAGLEFSYDDLLEKVKADYNAQTGKKATATSAIKIYLKPEEKMVYYVVNEKFLGSVFLG